MHARIKKIPSGGGWVDWVLTTFFVINVFQRGVYRSHLRSNWTQGDVHTSISKEYIATCDFPGGLDLLPSPSGSAHAKCVCVLFVCVLESRPLGAMAWSEICGCSFFLSYSLVFVLRCS